MAILFFFSSRRRHTRWPRDWSSDVCSSDLPSLEGATNWFSTSFNPATRLYYVQTLEKCDVFTKSKAPWKAGSGYFGGSFEQAPGDTAQKVLRAIRIDDGSIAWELPQVGPGN